MFLQSDIESMDAILNNPRMLLIVGLLGLWSLIWKGIALWKAARNGQRNWFIIMLFANTIGILEIVYIFYFSRREGERSKNQK